jgi:hypothetical protein
MLVTAPITSRRLACSRHRSHNQEKRRQLADLGRERKFSTKGEGNLGLRDDGRQFEMDASEKGTSRARLDISRT